MSNLPQDPITPMAVGATAVHETFRSLVNAGFTEEQALELVKTITAEQVRFWLHYTNGGNK